MGFQHFRPMRAWGQLQALATAHAATLRAWGQLPSNCFRLYGPSHAGMGATAAAPSGRTFDPSVPCGHGGNELIEAGLDDLEDAYLGAAALEAHRRSGEATIPLDQVMRNLGLEG